MEGISSVDFHACSPGFNLRPKLVLLTQTKSIFVLTRIPFPLSVAITANHILLLCFICFKLWLWLLSSSATLLRLWLLSSSATLLHLLQASANLDTLQDGEQGHAIAVICGLELTTNFRSPLMDFYSTVGLIEDAESVFNMMLQKDVVTWNLLISGYVQNGEVDKALNACRLMRPKNLKFDSATLATLMSAFPETTIVDMYAEKIGCARRVFNTLITRDLILWNTMLPTLAELGHSGFLNNGQVNETKDMF
ncbi:hypothetical protein COP1_017787 [Malus domestica]